MYPVYEDIRRMGEEAGRLVLWHDGHGVPRFEAFDPALLGIYDDWAALFTVRCQACGEEFDCADGSVWSDLLRSMALDEAACQEAFERKGDPAYRLPLLVSWGDAPWHGERQCSGTTMTTEIVAIKGAWHRGSTIESFGWEPVEIPDDLRTSLLGLFTEEQE